MKNVEEINLIISKIQEFLIHADSMTRETWGAMILHARIELIVQFILFPTVVALLIMIWIGIDNKLDDHGDEIVVFDLCIFSVTAFIAIIWLVSLPGIISGIVSPEAHIIMKIFGNNP